MRAALAIAGVELMRLRRDRTAVLFVLVLPVAVIIVIGSTFSAAPVSLPIGVVVEESGPTADRVVATLEAADTIEPERRDDRADLDVAIRTGVLAGGVVVRDDVVVSVVDRADTNAGAVRSAVNGALARVGTIDAVAEQSATDRDEVVAVAEAVPPVMVGRTVVDEGLGEATSEFAYTAPSNLVLFMFINSLAAGAVLVDARHNGITRRWAAAPIPTRAIVGGVLLGRLGYAVVQGVLIIVVGAGLFDVTWGDPAAVTTLVGLFAVVSTGAGVLIGTLARAVEQTSAVGVPLGIGLGMLGGCMWPLEIVGDTMRTVGHLTPHAWAMDAFVTLIFDAGGVADIAVELAVLAGFAAALVGASSWLLRDRLV